MLKRPVHSVLIALTLAAGAQVDLAARRPQFLVCKLPDESVFRILIENFDGMNAAVHQCLWFWNGKPHGVER